MVHTVSQDVHLHEWPSRIHGYYSRFAASFTFIHTRGEPELKFQIHVASILVSFSKVVNYFYYSTFCAAKSFIMAQTEGNDAIAIAYPLDYDLVASIPLKAVTSKVFAATFGIPYRHFVPTANIAV